jgi:hypothetical protein
LPQRSAQIHGSVFSEGTQKELADVSLEIDDLLRQLIPKIASEEPARRVLDMDDGGFEDYFTRLALGVPK